MTENENATHGTYDPDDDATKVPERGYGEAEEPIEAVQEPESTTIPDRTITVYGRVLLEALNRVKHAAAKDEARPILTYIKVEPTERGIRLVAADNYRIGLLDLELAEPDESWGPTLLQVADFPILLPWLKAQGDLPVQWTITSHDEGQGGKLLFEAPGAMLGLRSGWGTYPDYQSVLPKVKPGQAPTVALNPRLLAEAGKAMKGDMVAEIFVTDPLKAVLVRVPGSDYQEIIMPVRTVSTR